VGAVSADGYSYSSSIAIIDGKFVGLALDDVNESGKTEERINSWVEEIKKNL
jgi:flavodoxin I